MVYTSSYKGSWGNFGSTNWFPLLLYFCLISSHSSLQSNKEKAVCTELWDKVLLISITIPWLLLTEWPASSKLEFLSLLPREIYRAETKHQVKQSVFEIQAWGFGRLIQFHPHRFPQLNTA